MPNQGLISELLSMIYDPNLMSFAFGCAITSVAFVAVDFSYFVAQGRHRSLLDITYRGNNFILIIVTWFFGALVVGYFAAFISIFETSKISLFAIGVLWPVALSKLIEGAKGHLGSIEPEEPIEEEE